MDFSSFVPLRNVREGARDFGNANFDFGNENFHCGSFVVTVYHQGHSRVLRKYSRVRSRLVLNVATLLCSCSALEFFIFLHGFSPLKGAFPHQHVITPSWTRKGTK